LTPSHHLNQIIEGLTGFVISVQAGILLAVLSFTWLLFIASGVQNVVKAPLLGVA
jgi:hypothetical protein